MIHTYPAVHTARFTKLSLPSVECAWADLADLVDRLTAVPAQPQPGWTATIDLATSRAAAAWLSQQQNGHAQLNVDFDLLVVGSGQLLAVECKRFPDHALAVWEGVADLRGRRDFLYRTLSQAHGPSAGITPRAARTRRSEGCRARLRRAPTCRARLRTGFYCAAKTDLRNAP